MSVHVSSWAWKQTVGDAGAKLLLLKLADQANDRGECWPSQRRLAQECEMGRKTVQRKIDLLRAAGLIETSSRTREDGGSSSLLYHLCVPGCAVHRVRQSDAPPYVTSDAPPASLVTHHEPSVEPRPSDDVTPTGGLPERHQVKDLISRSLRSAA